MRLDSKRTGPDGSETVALSFLITISVRLGLMAWPSFAHQFQKPVKRLKPLDKPNSQHRT